MDLVLRNLLLWMTLAVLGLLITFLILVIREKLRREKEAGHRIRVAHLIHPFDGITVIGD